MKIGTLYDMARHYLPDINTTMFTEFYQQALDKLCTDVNISRVTETVATSSLNTNDIVKIYHVTYNGEEIQRIF